MRRPPPLVFALPGFAALRMAGDGVEMAELAVDRFANDELRVRLAADVAGHSCALIGSVAPPGDQLVGMLLAADTLRRHGAASITALLPYLAYTRQDRTERGSSLAAAWLGSVLQASGVDRVVTIDIHSAAAQKLIGVPVVSLSPAAVLARGLADVERGGLVVVAPDAGAVARSRDLAATLDVRAPVAWFEKTRSPVGVVHGILVGELAPRAIVVDDILDTGGTLVSCCAELRRRGVESIVCAVTHGLFSGDGWRALAGLGVDELHTTDSVPDVVRRAAPVAVRVHAVGSLLLSALVDTPDLA